MMHQAYPLRSADPAPAGGEASPAKLTGFTPIKTDLSPEIGSIRALARQVHQWWTSKMHSSRHLDNLTKIADSGAVLSKLHGISVGNWHSLSNSAPAAVKNNISAASHPVGEMIKTASNSVRNVLEKLSQELQDATGSSLDSIRQDRRYMNNEERAKISKIYRSYIGAYTAAEKQFNAIIEKLNSVTNTVADLLKTENSVRMELGKAVELSELESKHFPGIAAGLKGYYEGARNAIFARFSGELAPDKNPSVDTVSLQAKKAADELKALQTKLAGVIETSKKAVEAKAQIAKTAACLRDIEIPSDVPANRVVVVSEQTFKSIKSWFEREVDASQKRLNGALTRTDDGDYPQSAAMAVESYEAEMKRQREMVQGVARAVQPLVELVDPKLAGIAKDFTETAEGCQALIEQAAIRAMQNYAHEIALQKLEALRAIAGKVGTKAKAELSSPDNLTEAEGKEILESLNAEIEKVFRKSWI